MSPLNELPNDVKRAVVTLKIVIDKSQALISGQPVPGGSALLFALRHSAPRALTTAGAIYLLLSGGLQFGIDAVTLSRSLWELAVTLEYMCGCPRHCEELAIRFLAQNLSARRAQVGWLQADADATAAAFQKEQSIRGDECVLITQLVRLLMTDGLARRDALEAAVRRMRSEWRYKPTWSGLTIRQMAHIVKRPGCNRAWEYERAYPFLSEASHVSSGSLVALAAALGSADEFPPFQGRDPARLAASTAVIWLLQILDVVGEALGVNWRPTLEALSEAAQDQWRQAGIVQPLPAQ